MQKQEKTPRNFWLEGPTLLTDLPEIGKGLRSLLRNCPELKKPYQKNGILPWKKQPDGFEGLVYIILAQQISTAVASHLCERLRGLLPEITPRRLLKLDDEKLRAIGVSRQKIDYCKNLAETIIARKFDPSAIESMEDSKAFEYLTDLKGIGLWSAEIYLMFCLGRGDIWPAGDIALQKGLQNIHGLKTRPTPQKARKLGDVWMPYRSAASLIVWRA